MCEENGALGPFQSAGAVLLGTLGFDDHIVIGHVADGLGRMMVNCVELLVQSQDTKEASRELGYLD